MFSREWIERFDASYGIPRKANEQYLPSYQAFWQWSGDLGMCLFFVLLGMIGALLCLYAGILLNVYGLITMVFWAMALMCVAGSLVDAYSLMWAYRIQRMSTAHGSARWAKASDLIRCGLMNPIRGLPIPANALPIAKAFRGRDVFLPTSQWLRHFVMFGPTGSGKSKTFFMSMIRAILNKSSCLVYDPKGELFAQTANSAKTIYRLDLNDPTKSDRWNFIPKCRNDPAFACQIAGMMLGIESRRRTNADPFWGDAEQIALTAILLHIAEVYGEKAIPAFAADFLLFMNADGENTFNEVMMNSPSRYAKQAYMAFRQAPVQTRGSILIGLYNKLRPFTLAPARKVTTPPTHVEALADCRNIDFADLRQPGTAIYLVVSEGAADMYKEFIASFIGQALMEMRLDGANEPEHPCFVLIDEAYQLNVSEVKRISGIGRGRGVGLGLGYQDLPQMYDQYGREPANAILGTIMTKIFLPGLDDVTAEYASKQLGDTTIFSKTFQDFPGKKQDNTRYAEQKRALMQPNEIRQTAAHSEVLIISDTAPPIRAAYPPFAVHKNIFHASTKGTPAEIHLGDVDPQFLLSAPVERGVAAERDEAALKAIISAGVDRICTTERLTELIALGRRKSGYDVLRDEIEVHPEETDPVNNALDSLPQDVRSVTLQGNRNSFDIEHASI
ncbi:MAG: type IV secretory system conjugative DNA transfer family protein [Pyrinomonadaceae bacterium]